MTAFRPFLFAATGLVAFGCAKPKLPASPAPEAILTCSLNGARWQIPPETICLKMNDWLVVGEDAEPRAFVSVGSVEPISPKNRLWEEKLLKKYQSRLKGEKIESQRADSSLIFFESHPKGDRFVHRKGIVTQTNGKTRFTELTLAESDPRTEKLLGALWKGLSLNGKETSAYACDFQEMHFQLPPAALSKRWDGTLPSVRLWNLDLPHFCLYLTTASHPAPESANPKRWTHFVTLQKNSDKAQYEHSGEPQVSKIGENDVYFLEHVRAKPSYDRQDGWIVQGNLHARYVLYLPSENDPSRPKAEEFFRQIVTGLSFHSTGPNATSDRS